MSTSETYRIALLFNTNEISTGRSSPTLPITIKLAYELVTEAGLHNFALFSAKHGYEEREPQVLTNPRKSIRDDHEFLAD